MFNSRPGLRPVVLTCLAIVSLASAQASFIGELRGGGLSFGQRRIEAQAHREILGVARVVDLGAFGIHHARDVQGVVQLEGGRSAVVVQRDEADFGGGDEGLGGRLDFGVDGVVFDANARAALLSLSGGGEGGEREENDRPWACPAVKHG